MAYNKYFDNKTKRVLIKSICVNCGETRIIRWDHFRQRYLKEGKELKCKACSKIKFNGYEHQTGYVIRHWRSYDKEYWPILIKMCKKNGQIKEHRANVAISIGRSLKDNEIVHHKNGIRNDNRIDNLELCMFRQPMGQRVEDLLEENLMLRNKLKEVGVCL